MAHSLTTIGRHLECAIQTKLVVEPDIGLPSGRNRVKLLGGPYPGADTGFPEGGGG